ncbi:Heterogeneous nuclear ribonucleoprotein 1 [Acorus gramineus]|uniref:Heterogeneous nuclear ribonucleoprotein 1 n=1 Tax=Acorus gramineus TaxID=55184 RepID=A0AAV9BFZ5_ACOGR|nr:Heterogeneous nuclear ribonucleoprotein 1 [Acorus gramineus]
MESETKIYIGKLPSEVEEESLKEHFKVFGEVLEITIVKDGSTGRPRGFGFVKFSDSDSVRKALYEENHLIYGEKIVVKRTIPRNQEQYRNHRQHNNHMEEPLNEEVMDGVQPNKIFVGGLPKAITVQEFHEFFVQFGPIKDSVVMHDKVTGRPRGFGFVTFVSAEVVENIVQTRLLNLNGKTVEIMRAIRKVEVNNNQQNHQQQQQYDNNINNQQQQQYDNNINNQQQQQQQYDNNINNQHNQQQHLIINNNATYNNYQGQFYPPHHTVNSGYPYWPYWGYDGYMYYLTPGYTDPRYNQNFHDY